MRTTSASECGAALGVHSWPSMDVAGWPTPPAAVLSPIAAAALPNKIVAADDELVALPDTAAAPAVTLEPDNDGFSGFDESGVVDGAPIESMAS